MEDVYFPLRRRKDLFFETPLQGRTTFGQTPGQTSQGREHGRHTTAATASSAGHSEALDGVAQGLEGQASL